MEIGTVRFKVLTLARLLFLTASAVTAQRPNAPYPPPGELVDVGGHRVHLYCTGEGSPTVMIVGAGFSFDWGLVQPEAAKFTKVCTYDPSGWAWSEPGSGLACGERVAEIQKLLSVAGKGPYVLVGLSVGALVARLYASQYPSEVAGMVIVDHAFINTDKTPPDTRPQHSSYDSPPILLHATPIVWTIEDDPNFSRLPKRNRDLYRWAVSLSPKLLTVQIAEACISEVETATQNHPEPLGKMPLLVISTANESPNYMNLQAKLLSLSHNSKQLIAEKSFHAIHIDQPDRIITAIQEVVEAVRRGIKLKK